MHSSFKNRLNDPKDSLKINLQMKNWQMKYQNGWKNYFKSNNYSFKLKIGINKIINYENIVVIL